MFELKITDRWHQTFPGGHVGLLLLGQVDNTVLALLLNDRKRALEAQLRARYEGWTREQLLELEVLSAYRVYYKTFGQTYHVQGQLESVALKGKALPNVSPLVDASFLAELDTLVLTASHDADQLDAPLTLDATQGGETLIQRSGAVRTLKAGDMVMSDAQGVICTILYGQDQRTPVSAQTRRVLYVTYAPAGVPVTTVQHQFDLIEALVRSFAPDAMTQQRQVYTARPLEVG